MTDKLEEFNIDEATKAIEADKQRRAAEASKAIAAICEQFKVTLIPKFEFVGSEMRGDVLILAR